MACVWVGVCVCSCVLVCVCAGWCVCVCFCVVELGLNRHFKTGTESSLSGPNSVGPDKGGPKSTVAGRARTRAGDTAGNNDTRGSEVTWEVG